MVLRELPPLARYYRYAFQTPCSRKAEFLLFAPLRKLFPLVRRSGLLPYRGRFEYERCGKAFQVEFDARNVQFQALYSRVYPSGYEQELGLLIDCLLPEGGILYDIGSNWGYFTLYAASNRQELSIHAFEPVPNTHRDLKSSVEQAGLTNLVTRHEFALADTNGEAFIEIPDGVHSGTAELTLNPKGTRIVTRQLDSLQLSAPHFIKMDVEGHEAAVLRGASHTLQSSWPYIVFENSRNYASPDTTLEPLRLLSDLVYRLFLPSVKRSKNGCDYHVPCGWQMEINRAQEVNDGDYLALAPFEASDRFLFQHDLNVFACHESKLSELRSRFA